jgi:hypothetical protein
MSIAREDIMIIHNGRRTDVSEETQHEKTTT